MSNFEGIQKNARPFKPQTRASDGAGVGRVIGGVFAGQDAPVVFEKADSPTLDTTPTPRTDGRGESEIGLSGQVDHPNNDGDARYAAAQIAREYRQLVAPVGGIENLSVEQRRQMRDELCRRVGATEDGAQQPEGDSASARATRQYVREVASLLFGLADEIPGTPTFLTRSETSDMHKMEGGVDETECPHCHTLNRLDKLAVGAVGNTRTGLVTFTCTHCARKWEENPSERA